MKVKNFKRHETLELAYFKQCLEAVLLTLLRGANPHAFTHSNTHHSATTIDDLNLPAWGLFPETGFREFFEEVTSVGSVLVIYRI